jgi:hypothetical protein
MQYSYDADLIRVFLKKNEKKPMFNFTLYLIDDDLLLSNNNFGDYVDRI